MPGHTTTKRKTSKKGGKRRKSYGGSQLKKDLQSLEQLLGGYSSSGGKTDYDRYFTVHTVNGRPAKEVLKGETGRYGMSKSGGPLGAAKKAYTSMLHKLGLKNKGQSTELTFEMREVTKILIKDMVVQSMDRMKDFVKLFLKNYVNKIHFEKTRY